MRWRPLDFKLLADGKQPNQIHQSGPGIDQWLHQWLLSTSYGNIHRRSLGTLLACGGAISTAKAYSGNVTRLSESRVAVFATMTAYCWGGVVDTSREIGDE